MTGVVTSGDENAFVDLCCAVMRSARVRSAGAWRRAKGSTDP